jgi:hypothetical protein
MNDKQSKSCAICKTKQAPFGIKRDKHRNSESDWYCHAHWLWLPSTQTLMAARLEAAGEEK